MLVTPASLNSIFLGFNTLFQSGFESVIPSAEVLATSVPSATRSNVYAHLGKMLRMRQWIGEREIQNVESFSYQLDNLPFELTLEVERRDIVDDQLGVYAPLFQTMGAQTRMWMDDLIVAALVNGTSGSTYDKVPFFSTSHPIDAAGRVAGTQSNTLIAADLTETTLDAAVQAMAQFQLGDQRTIGVRGTHLVVPPQLELKAKKLVKAEYNAAGASNMQYGTLQVLVLPQLATYSGTTWYVMDLSKPIKPFVSQVREAPNFVQRTAEDSEPRFKKDAYQFGSMARGNAGYGLWFTAVRNSTS